MSKTGALDSLQQVHELNRAFLELLHTRARQGRFCLGLPPAAGAELATASRALLDGVACFQRALFRAEIAQSAQLAAAESSADFDEVEHDLCLSVLIAARQTSRQSSFHARLFFGLTAADVALLSAAPLTDLQRLAGTPGVLGCALGERPWFWRGLLTANRPELRRQLTLMALQPAVALGWPQRRPPQASA